MYLVLIETSGNQNYIFATNKLRENIGASQLTYRAGTWWILEAVAKVTKAQCKGKQLAENLMNPQHNPQINSDESKGVEIVLAASGKAILIVNDKEKAKTIIQYVTTKALKESPGLEICGTIKEFDWDKDKLGEIIQKIHKELESMRSQKPSSHLRFLRLPVVDECSTSGLPASVIQRNPENELEIVSHVSKLKQDQRQEAFNRIKFLIGDKPGTYITEPVHPEPNYIDHLENHSDWLAIVHADGNGLGEIFLKFHEHIGANSAEDNRTYVDLLRKFSLALDHCTLSAFRTALNKVPQLSHHPDEALHIVPLVLGGDDLTVVCDGRYALKFTYEFLKAFEAETSNTNGYCGGIIPKIAEKALGIGKLSTCAGIAIIKPHFPFFIAYELAESLIKSAKTVKKKVTNPSNNKPYPCSAIDFHVLYDSSDVDLDKIRIKITLDENTLLYRRPFVVTPTENLPEENKAWAGFHHWNELQRRIEILNAKEDGKHKLPNSQTHNLRSGLFLGKDAADARYKLIRDRYRNADIVTLAGSEDSLFQADPTTGKQTTALIDAIDAAAFLGDPNGQE
jgi:hypothetical protein